MARTTKDPVGNPRRREHILSLLEGNKPVLLTVRCIRESAPELFTQTPTATHALLMQMSREGCVVFMPYQKINSAFSKGDGARVFFCKPEHREHFLNKPKPKPQPVFKPDRYIGLHGVTLAKLGKFQFQPSA